MSPILVSHATTAQLAVLAPESGKLVFLNGTRYTLDTHDRPEASDLMSGETGRVVLTLATEFDRETLVSDDCRKVMLAMPFVQSNC